MKTKTICRLVLILSLATLPALITLPPSTRAAQKSDEVARALQIIAQMRRATFGEIKLESVKGLSLSWRTRQSAPTGGQITGELTYDLLLPNKMVRKETRNLPGNMGQIFIHSVLNGEQVWRDVSASTTEISGMKAGRGDPARQLQALRKEQALQMIRLALSPSPDFPLTFVYVGEAEASDGQAHVLDVRGPNDFSSRIFIDKTTSRLLMMTYRGQDVPKLSSREGKGITGAPTQITEEKARFSDYKAKNGVMLPHLVTLETRGKIYKEHELTGFKLNPSFGPNHFEPGKKKR